MQNCIRSFCKQRYRTVSGVSAQGDTGAVSGTFVNRDAELYQEYPHREIRGLYQELS